MNRHQNSGPLITIIFVILCCWQLRAMDGSDDTESELSEGTSASKNDNQKERPVSIASSSIDFDQLPSTMLVKIVLKTKTEIIETFQTFINKKNIISSKGFVKISANLKDKIDIETLPDIFDLGITIYGGPKSVTVLVPYKKTALMPMVDSDEKTHHIPFDCGVFASVLNNLPSTRSEYDESNSQADAPDKAAKSFWATHFGCCFCCN